MAISVFRTWKGGILAFFFGLSFLSCGCGALIVLEQHLASWMLSHKELHAFNIVGCLFFVVCFGGIGCLFSWVGFSCFSAISYQKKKRKVCPNTPWLWNKTWILKRILGCIRFHAIFTLWLFTVFNLMSFLPILATALDPPDSRNGSDYVPPLLFFGVANVFFFLWVLKILRRWYKYGEAVFVMSEVPGVVGGSLTGVIDIPGKMESESCFRITLKGGQLRLINIFDIFQGKKVKTLKAIPWEQTQFVLTLPQQETPAGHTLIPIEFIIPDNAAECDRFYSTPYSYEGSLEWWLQVKSETPEVDYETKFNVPVFRTENSPLAPVTIE
jgi:hypothetical protein